MELGAAPDGARLIATRSRHPRALEAERVAAAFSQNGVSASPVAPVSKAVDVALAESGPGRAGVHRRIAVRGGGSAGARLRASSTTSSAG